MNLRVALPVATCVNILYNAFFVLAVIIAYLEPQTTRNKWLFPYCSEESLQYPFITHGCLGKPLIAAGCLGVNLLKLSSQREIIFSHHAEQNWIHKSSDFFGVPCWLLDSSTHFFPGHQRTLPIMGPREGPPAKWNCWAWNSPPLRKKWSIHQPFTSQFTSWPRPKAHPPGKRERPITMNLPPPVFHSSNLASQPKSSIPQNITSYQTRAEHQPIFGD